MSNAFPKLFKSNRGYTTNLSPPLSVKNIRSSTAIATSCRYWQVPTSIADGYRYWPPIIVPAAVTPTPILRCSLTHQPLIKTLYPNTNKSYITATILSPTWQLAPCTDAVKTFIIRQLCASTHAIRVIFARQVVSKFAVVWWDRAITCTQTSL